MDHVILVDERDNEFGTMDKMEAHIKGALHRAFSVLLFNSKGEILLQKRSAFKYHSAGLWTNTCCSHPKPGETMETAIKRRLMEEMGIDLQPEYLFKFIYHVELSNNLIEHELDHVYIGQFNGEPIINSVEVERWKYAEPAAVKKDMLQNPEAYTYWFSLILNRPELQNILNREIRAHATI
ncbi:isopentenyl-diphosphate delta-isomerase [Chryseolinea serpens]|uniref:Isopentenyl-diphosphate delta-isomerase n=1 Tax=Chryseolinea serpens TaxID=947013 RepID=A0A1M5XT20_9BACT|nr:isopentenyl-diphosphate Delta-isomerase [Chryseolinea serpens]SHI02852.1 isopentenyl-diphosphate delta-isomerase [Chryseolinea serpens]